MAAGSKSISVDKVLRAAKAAEKKGNLEEAAQCYRQVLERFPQNMRAQEGIRRIQPGSEHSSTEPSAELITGAITLFQRGEAEKARTAARVLVEQYPKSSAAANLAGAFESYLGAFDAAEKYYSAAIELDPDNADAHNNLGSTLNDNRQYVRALPELERALALKPDDAGILNNLGNSHNGLGNLETALGCFREATKIKPDFHQAYKNLGQTLNALGRRDEAIAAYTKALGIRPDYAECIYNLGLIKKCKPDDPLIAQTDRLAGDTNKPANERMYLNFALGKMREDLKEVDAAFAHYAEGNRLQRLSAPYDYAADQRLFAGLKSLFEAGSIPFGVNPEGRPHSFKQPIFVVGMPRSGTTLVEQILASHSKVYGAGELDKLGEIMSPAADILRAGGSVEFAPDSIKAIAEHYYARLEMLEVGEPIVVDKMPANFRWIGFILAAMPDAKIVHLQRDPVAVCWSAFKRCFPAKGNAFSCDLTDTARYYKHYSDLMDFWHARFPNRIYDINYERLTENQEDETRKLLGYCELDWEDQCLAFHKTGRAVKTASAAQVRHEMYTGSSKAWHAYADHLQPLIQELGDLAQPPVAPKSVSR